MDGLSFHVVYEDVYVPMRDGIRLSGDLYLPALGGVVDDKRRWPCVLIRTPYNKSVVNPDNRNPGIYWTQNGYACFIQDVRGRFKSEGVFYKYTGEAEDGYDSVEWLAKQWWSNGSIVSDGPSYLCHVQTSMALLRPPHLRAMFLNKGGFFNAHTSGVRQGGAYEARQWVWGLKNANRRQPLVKDALEIVERNFDGWLARYPWKRGDSPLSISSEYESYLFDQVEKESYGPYWRQIGLNTEEYLDEFADIPGMFMSGWFDIYARSTIEFFSTLSRKKRGPFILIMGPWQHVGPEAHVAGEVDFGVNALITGNLAPNVFSLARRWFDRFVEHQPLYNAPLAATPTHANANAAANANANNSGAGTPSPTGTSSNSNASGLPSSSSSSSLSASSASLSGSASKSSREQKLMMAIAAAQQHIATANQTAHAPVSAGATHNLLSPSSVSASSSVHADVFHSFSASSAVGPYTSMSLRPWGQAASSASVHSHDLNAAPSLYLLPQALPRERIPPRDAPLPPFVRYFRMGGGDGHRTSQGFMFHGGIWLQCATWPPAGTKEVNFFLQRRQLVSGLFDDEVKRMTRKHVIDAAQSHDAKSEVEKDDRDRDSKDKLREQDSVTGSAGLHVEQIQLRIDPSSSTSASPSPAPAITASSTSSSSSSSVSSSSTSSSSSSSLPSARRLELQYANRARRPVLIPRPAGVSTGWWERESSYEERFPPPNNELIKKCTQSPPSLSEFVTAFQYNPLNPCPSIGGHVFSYKNILLSGAYDQVERPDHFMCRAPFLPLSSRRDVIVFRTAPLEDRVDVTGSPFCILYVSSDCVDTDFTAKLIDEYPPSADYPHGFAMLLSHGIIRCRHRDDPIHSKHMTPGKVYEVKIELYPTSNLFSKGHRIRVDISSSNFPHFDLNLNTGEDSHSTRVLTAENSVWHCSAFPSRIVLPIQTLSHSTATAAALAFLNMNQD